MHFLPFVSMLLVAKQHLSSASVGPNQWGRRIEAVLSTGKQGLSTACHSSRHVFHTWFALPLLVALPMQSRSENDNILWCNAWTEFEGNFTLVIRSPVDSKYDEKRYLFDPQPIQSLNNTGVIMIPAECIGALQLPPLEHGADKTKM